MSFRKELKNILKELENENITAKEAEEQILEEIANSSFVKYLMDDCLNDGTRCNCRCHRDSSVRHVIPCCGQSPVVYEEGKF